MRPSVYDSDLGSSEATYISPARRIQGLGSNSVEASPRLMTVEVNFLVHTSADRDGFRFSTVGRRRFVDGAEPAIHPLEGLADDFVPRRWQVP